MTRAFVATLLAAAAVAAGCTNEAPRSRANRKAPQASETSPVSATSSSERVEAIVAELDAAGYPCLAEVTRDVQLPKPHDYPELGSGHLKMCNIDSPDLPHKNIFWFSVFALEDPGWRSRFLRYHEPTKMPKIRSNCVTKTYLIGSDWMVESWDEGELREFQDAIGGNLRFECTIGLQ